MAQAWSNDFFLGRFRPPCYSYEIPNEFPMNTFKGEGASREKWFQLNVIFLKIVISLLPYFATFLKQLYFRRSYFFAILLSNYIDTAVTFSKKFCEIPRFSGAAISSKQLLFWGVPFLEQSLLYSSHFFRIAQSKSFTEKPLLENRKSFRAFTFRNSFLFGGRIV